MQWPVLKIIMVLFIATGAFFTPAHSQVFSYRLQKADSLFAAKQFTQSLAHYEEIFTQGQYTPAMFLKMAFVEEGLNEIGKTLYYLNLYHLATGDDAVLAKMEQLSKKHKLQGYTFDETSQVALIYQKYHDKVSMAIGALMLLLVSLAVFLKRRGHKPIAAVATVLFLAVVFGFHLSMKETDTQVIVAENHNYLMAGPSGAADVVDVIDGGHRFEIEKRYDIWVQVRWNGRTAFIRDHQVLPVRL